MTLLIYKSNGFSMTIDLFASSRGTSASSTHIRPIELRWQRRLWHYTLRDLWKKRSTPRYGMSRVLSGVSSSLRLSWIEEYLSQDVPVVHGHAVPGFVPWSWSHLSYVSRCLRRSAIGAYQAGTQKPKWSLQQYHRI